MVTAAVAKSILPTFSGQQKASAACVQVISAFSVPRVRYDPIRNAFYKPPGKPTLHGLAEVESAYLRRVWYLGLLSLMCSYSRCAGLAGHVAERCSLSTAGSHVAAMLGLRCGCHAVSHSGRLLIHVSEQRAAGGCSLSRDRICEPA